MKAGWKCETNEAKNWSHCYFMHLISLVVILFLPNNNNNRYGYVPVQTTCGLFWDCFSASDSGENWHKKSDLRGSTPCISLSSLRHLIISSFISVTIILHSLVTWHNYKENEVLNISHCPLPLNFSACRAQPTSPSQSLCRFAYIQLPGRHI